MQGKISEFRTFEQAASDRLALDAKARDELAELLKNLDSTDAPGNALDTPDADTQGFEILTGRILFADDISEKVAELDNQLLFKALKHGRG